eukprot:NODE_275_length_12088_cov_0.250813.p3 type:complete len:385 gc:universal NODE_275_length_12088_cov_0.250813:10068-8914(-)
MLNKLFCYYSFGCRSVIIKTVKHLHKKNMSYSIFIGVLLWMLIILDQYSTEYQRINKPDNTFFRVNCNRSESAINHKTVTKTVVVTQLECLKEPLDKRDDKKCDDAECKSKSGNCQNHECHWDSGYELDLNAFNPPKKTAYSWESESVTYEKVSSYSETSIPPIFHQSWKNTKVPDKYVEWENSCIDTHKKWDYLLWTDDDNRQLISEEYPWLLYTYDRLKNNIQRADFSRYVYLHHFGGIYADLDVECLKNSDDLITDKVVVLGVLGDDYNFIHNIPNAILGSRKGHPFWLFLINRIAFLMHQNDGPEAMTGPIILRDSYRLFSKYEQYKDDFYVAKPGILYGVDWHRPPTNCVAAFGQYLDAKQCKKLFPDAFMITYWTHSW